MKKIFYGTCILLLATFSYSCTKVTSPSTYEFRLLSYDWVASGTAGSSNYLYLAEHIINDITDGVVASGAVLGYIKQGTLWTALPYTDTNGGYTSFYNYSYTKGEVIMTIKNSNLLTTAPLGYIDFKVVILTEKEMHLLEGVNTNNYSEVEQALNLTK